MPYNGKINYYKKSVATIESFSGEKKPTLLMHVCCGPCSCFPLTFLCPHFDVALYFNNSNIYPESEYQRRLNELLKLLESIKKDYGYDINVIINPYDNEGYMKDLAPFATQREGGERCRICYRKRMEEAYDYAENNGFDYFCTVMTISRQKDSQILNSIGRDLEAKHSKTKYFYSDFKKNKGIDKGQAMREHYNLYKQEYCGCVYSYQSMLKKEETKTKN
ncbi:MAG: epoxyqueuosine reductase QueH [Bacilli bacterium]|nr:epoxyqueuosine reductase QueH [Bacilli bacterium]